MNFLRLKKLKGFKQQLDKVKVKSIKSRKHHQRTFVELKEVTKLTSFQHIRKSVSKYVKTKDWSLLSKHFHYTNHSVLVSLGYKPHKTKKKKQVIERVYDGYNCRTRRQAKIQLRSMSFLRSKKAA